MKTQRRVRIPPASIADSKLPIGGTITLWLLLDRLKLAGWIVGAAWTLWAILCVLVIAGVVYAHWNTEQITAGEIADRLDALENRSRGTKAG